MKEAEAASSGGRLPLVVGGLLGVGVGIAALTFLFWRHTRPGYDDYYPYDDEVDDAAADPDSLSVTAVSDAELVGAGAPVGAAAVGAAAGASALTRSAYPPDDQATVVVKPLSELQEAKVGNGSGGSSTPSGTGAVTTELAKGTTAGEGGAALAVGATGLVAGAAAEKRDESVVDGDDQNGSGATISSAPVEGDETLVGVNGLEPDGVGADASRFVRAKAADGVALSSAKPISTDVDRAPSVLAFADLGQTDDGPRGVRSDESGVGPTSDPASANGTAVGEAPVDETDEPDSASVPVVHRIDDLQYERGGSLVGPDTAEEPVVESHRADEFLDDDEVDLLYTGEHERLGTELDHDGGYGEPDADHAHDSYVDHDSYVEQGSYVEGDDDEEEIDDWHDGYDDDRSEAHDEYDVDPYTDEREVPAAPAPAVAGSSAVTILGPMRPGKEAGSDADGHVLLEPEPLEIVTLEDIEQARAGSRSGDRRG